MPNLRANWKASDSSNFGSANRRRESKKCGNDVTRKAVTVETHIIVTRSSVDLIIPADADIVLLQNGTIFSNSVDAVHYRGYELMTHVNVYIFGLSQSITCTITTQKGDNN